LQEKKSILIFGAGKIGRSFIGQLFGLSGYEVVFSDIDLQLVEALNRERSYTVVIKGPREERLTIPNVRAIHGTDEASVIEEITRASIMAVSVGKNALEKIIPTISKGLTKRFQHHEDRPVDIIIAENMRSADEFMYERLKQHLPPDFPIDDYVGLIETSIGKMVPIMTAEELKKDPLSVFAEPYNELILDKKGFKNKIPNVKGLAPKENIKAWVDRKAFIHNLGHTTTAYYGYYKHPEATYLYEVLQDETVLQFTKGVMLQSAEVLLNIYPDDFTDNDLTEHIDDLLFRFQNRSLKDTLFRVGQDIPRKLGPDDRFMGAIRTAITSRTAYDHILKAMLYACTFKAVDENGHRAAEDLFFEQYMEKGLDFTLQHLCGMDPVRDQQLFAQAKDYYFDLFPPAYDG
jgi:mannitol-1-phosphate 5-dehydrogenase